MIAYKVLRKIGDRLFSVNPLLALPCQIEYEKSGETFPLAGTKLFVFESERGAEDFILEHREIWPGALTNIFEIWEVEIPDDSTVVDAVARVFLDDFISIMEELWRDGTRGLDWSVWAPSPEGTLGASKFSLKKLIRIL